MDVQADAAWAKGTSGSVTLMPIDLGNAYGSLRIQVRSCDTRLTSGKQQVTVTTSAGSQATVNWGSGDMRNKEVVLPIDAVSLAKGLTIHIRGSKIGPQLSWKTPTRFGSVGIVSIRTN
jgi:hypothetical protein